MSRAVALQLKSTEAVAVVVAAQATPIVEAVVRVPLGADDSPRRRGELIAEALAPYRKSRLPAVLAVARDALAWQNFSLPPAPDEDLAGLVLMQAERELSLPADGVGFDFLPLEGDAEHPRRVLGVGLGPKAWSEALEACEAAQLKLRHVIPEPFGWQPLAARALAGAEAAPGAGAGDGAHVGVAVEPGWAAIWADSGGAVRLARSVRLPDADDLDACAGILAGELRRTLLAFGQWHADAATADIWLAGGDDAAALAERLSAALHREVQVGRVRDLFDAAAVPASPDDWGALASLAAELASRNRPLLDLLNPRRPPAPPSRLRIYSLAGVAALVACGLIGWKANRNLKEPLEEAELAELERTALAETIEGFQSDLKRVAEISRWFAGGAEATQRLEEIAASLRPLPPDADGFSADQDVVVTRVNLVGAKATVEMATKNAEALRPLESRLRAAGYRVDRGTVNPTANVVPEYAVGAVETLIRETPVAEGNAPGASR
ncbi:MAG: hypothetical protein KF847_03925 [Pirellulales bacterium]|nr:hypothetical protein [Pirellulales bacterium]